MLKVQEEKKARELLGETKQTGLTNLDKPAQPGVSPEPDAVQHRNTDSNTQENNVNTREQTWCSAETENINKLKQRSDL